MLEAPKTLRTSSEALSFAQNRQEVMFADGTTIDLHQVYCNGTPVTQMRGLRHQGEVILFSMADVSRELANDLATLLSRDHQGCVFYGLRQRFKSAAEAVAAINEKARNRFEILPATLEAA
jgi:hypothetical protein